METLNREFKKTIVMVTHDPRAAERAHIQRHLEKGVPGAPLGEAMKYLPFVFKHLRRNWVRTASTVVAMAVCIFLLCTLQTVLSEVDSMLQASSATRLVTRHSVSLIFKLPWPTSRASAVPGVKRVAKTNWFGGALPAKKEGQADEGEGDSTTDWSKFFHNMAVDAEKFFPMYPELPFPPDQWQAFRETRQGCVIGSKLAKKFNWKIGDTFFLESFIPPYRKRTGPFEFVVSARLRRRPREVPGHRRIDHVLPLRVPEEGIGRRVGRRAPTRSRSRTATRPPRSARPSTRSSRTATPTTMTETEQAFKRRLHRHGRQSRVPPERHRPRRRLHHPARDREHHEHGGARAAHGDRAC